MWCHMFALLTSLKHQSVPKCSVPSRHNLGTCHKGCPSTLGPFKWWPSPSGHHLKGRRTPPEAGGIKFLIPKLKCLIRIGPCFVSPCCEFSMPQSSSRPRSRGTLSSSTVLCLTVVAFQLLHHGRSRSTLRSRPRFVQLPASNRLG